MGVKIAADFTGARRGDGSGRDEWGMCWTCGVSYGQPHLAQCGYAIWLSNAKPAPEPKPAQEEPGGRQLIFTTADMIKPRRVSWLWQDRLALGTLALIAGREGVGKCTLAYWLASQVTRGQLPGEHLDKPRSVLVAATEDSWEHTIVPRLIAADADLTRVIKVEVDNDGIHGEVTLPRDLAAVREYAVGHWVSLMLLDPLMSRLDDRLDTHRDGQVRLALEPLVAIADQANLAVVGLIQSRVLHTRRWNVRTFDG